MPPNLQQRSTLAGEAAASAAEVETALNHPLDPTAAAFFDVDNTVMQGASIFHFARGLHRREFFTTREILGGRAGEQVGDVGHVGDRSADGSAHPLNHGRILPQTPDR